MVFTYGESAFGSRDDRNGGNGRSGFSTWTDLGGDIAGGPVAIDDPASGYIEPRSGWQQWQSLNGSITDSPDPVYDAVDSPLNVFAHGAGGPLFQIGSSASWLDLTVGGSMIGSPDGLYDTASGNLECYGVTSAGDLFEAHHTSSGWEIVNLSGGLTLAGF